MDTVYVICAFFFVISIVDGQTIFHCTFSDTFCGFSQEFPGNGYQFDVSQYLPSPLVGPTDGNTMFLYTDTADNNLADWASAEVNSPAITNQPGPFSCLEFAYYMRSADPQGFLDAYKDDEKVWSLSKGYKTGIPKLWHKAAVTLKGTSMKLRFVFNVTSFKDVIALNYVKVQTGKCLSDLAVGEPYSCDLDDDSLCGLAQEPLLDDLEWTWISGRSSTLDDTGPTSDHTTGSGSYLVVESTSHHVPPRDVATLGTPLIHPNSTSVRSCLSFAYSMNGADVRTLSVLVSTTPPDRSRETADKVWAAKGPQGSGWKTLKLDLLTLQRPYKVFFEASKGKGPKGDIAIDDIDIQPGDCSPLGFLRCEFVGLSETEQCDIFRLEQEEGGPKWTRTSGASPVSHGPTSDRFGNAGFYLSLRAEDEPTGSNATMVTTVLDTKSDLSCLTFWYHFNLPPNATEWQLQVSRADPDLSGTEPVYTVEERSQGDTWHRAAVTVDSSTPYRIVILGRVGTEQNSTTVAVDDVEVTPGPCPVDRVMKKITCDFNDPNQCGWGQGDTDQFRWFWQKGPTTDSVFTGPSDDRSGQGHYMYIESSQPQTTGDKARLVTPRTKASKPGESCLTFWYHMKGDTVGTLRVASLEPPVGNNNAETTLWQKKGHQADEWLQAVVKVDMTPDTPYQFIFEASVGGLDKGDIAIDDVELVNRPCQARASVSCDFESANFCDYRRVSRNSTEWIHTDGNVDERSGMDYPDHTTGNGSFMHARGVPQKSLLVSPSLVWNRAFGCLTFKLNISDLTLGTLNVYGAPTGLLYERTLLYTSRANYTSVVKVEVHTEFPIQLIFEGAREHGFDGNITVDDIRMSPERCDTPLDCAFTSDSCTFAKLAGGMALSVQKGQSSVADTGPSKDHTDGTGGYIYSEATSGDTLLIQSEVVDVNTADNCLQFWYHMQGQDIVSMAVFKASPDDSDTDRTDLFSRTGQHDQQWHGVRADVDGSKPFRLYVNFTSSGAKAESALDDVRLSVGGSCDEVAVQAAMDCDFETNLCGYTQLNADNSNDDNNWLRMSGTSGSSSQGGYLSLPSLQTNTTWAGPVLESPVLDGDSRKICLRFWWTTQVTNPNSTAMSVHAVDVTTGSTVARFNTSGYQGHGWQLEELSMDQNSPLMFRFEPSPSSTEDQLIMDFALDDVEVVNGTCTEVPWTREWEFQCDRPTTPCVAGTCDPASQKCNCPPDALGSDCSQVGPLCQSNRCGNGDCIMKNGVPSCACLDGYYGDHCENDMVYAECSREKMVINIFPYGFTEAVFENIKPPETAGSGCSLLPVSEFSQQSGYTRGWSGYAREFAHVNDPCAGDAIVDKTTPAETTYLRQVHVYYDPLGRHPRDHLVNVSCSVPSLPPAKITMEATELGTSVYSTRSGSGRGGWPSYIDLKFSLNIPNKDNADEMKLEACDLTIENVGTVNVVKDGCVVTPVGVMLNAGPQRGTEILMIRLFKLPGSEVALKLRCDFRMCATADNDFSCYRRSMCLNGFNSLNDSNGNGRIKRSANTATVSTRRGGLEARMKLNGGSIADVSYTFLG